VSPAGQLVFTIPIPVFTMPILAFTFRRSGCSRCSDPRVHDRPKSARILALPKDHPERLVYRGSNLQDARDCVAKLGEQIGSSG